MDQQETPGLDSGETHHINDEQYLTNSINIGTGNKSYILQPTAIGNTSIINHKGEEENLKNVLLVAMFNE